MALLHLTGLIKYQPLTLSFMPHQPHRYSVFMIMTGHENTLPLDLVMGAQPLEEEDTPFTYISGIVDRLRDVHQRVVPAEATIQQNPYRPGHLMGLHSSFREEFQAYTLLDRALLGDQGSNPYQVSYSTDRGSWTVHIYHAKPTLLDLLTKSPTPEDEPQQPSPIGCLLSAYPHTSTNRSKAWETASDPVSQPSQPPSPPMGLEVGPSAGHSSAPSTANENAAAQRSVNSPGVCKPPGVVWRTR